jgi:hypothetical protein
MRGSCPDRFIDCPGRSISLFPTALQIMHGWYRIMLRPFTTKPCRILPPSNHWIIHNMSWRQLHRINYSKVCQSQIKISRTCLAYIMQSDVNDLWTFSTRSLRSFCLHAARSIVSWQQLLGLEAGIERLALLPRVREVLLSNFVPDAGCIDFEISRFFPHPAKYWDSTLN